ncbi:MAG: M24 family metallopeptidase [Proteobacteria bacterium]|nr:M24 family metallopeptidase [Pseudomonadota bacterium]
MVYQKTKGFTKPQFSEEEMRRRLTGLRGAMEEIGIDAAVTTSLHNTLYYSNFWMIPFGREQAAVIPLNGEPAIVAPLIEYDRPKNMGRFKDVRIYPDTASSTDGTVRSVMEVLSDNGITRGKIGIEEDHMTLKLLTALRRTLPQFEFVDIGDAMMRQRLVKSDEEVALIRQGAEIADIGGQAFVEAIDDGVTEVQVARAAVTAMEEEICRRFPDFECDATWCWCQSGVSRTYVAHAPNTPRRIRKGDLLSLNTFPMIVGYYHALERSLVYGPMSEEIRRPFEVNVDAHMAGIEAVGPGVRCGDIDKAINPVYEKAGLLDYRTFGTGHSFGVMGFWYGREEGGELRPYNDNVLRENMVVSIEPMIAVPDVGGFRHHDMLLVTKDGHELLTKFPRGVINI